MVKGKRLRKSTDKPTLGDVAKAAGVSTATVSRALNQPHQVKEPLRLRIEEQINKLGYVRDGAARALASNKKRMIGAVIPTIDNAIFASGINALERRLYEEGYTLMLAVSNYDPMHELKQVRDIMEQGVDGLLLVGNEHAPETYSILEKHNQNFANLWVLDRESPYPSVGFDNFRAAQQITQYLINQGHRRFGFISGIMEGNDRATARLNGALSVLEEQGIALHSQDIVECRYDIWEGRNACRHLLSRKKSSRPSAIICGNDVLAFGCLTECRELDVSVPEEVSITGFDDLPLCEHLTPSLTTIHVPSQMMGERAAEFILDKIAGRECPSHIEVPTQLVVRESTAQAPS
ncbi:putative Transcriptional regulator LacI family [Vibrio nigripulchritudo SFn27]|uniref:Putative Transcriptional regulator LacI family n=1 Tax=Vibrio nigripulchritudo TaxID=28173 RepID=U4KC89_9VIBR|nr:LacI family DNA-binding transcriptional regulator [Vibrio nigripulchritudo]CCN83436.1 putative Transcriptional regulator LacI family [Vibrio nigripulchritudo BLFn1]CCN88795.1 putative Transcriptional regulator LacI family [Vibrio nigripulchritudo SFn27]CCN94977.1 putative Transcriptional regulator LacI family [Vibrio nigripulchritudo ENn2]CCO41140.1 putative Transcriptional regulator LacI family [Vibrio nigripulchritudo SFn135]CCO52457.1 putative Transcriptional regulator LacI family [Vibri